MKTIHILPSEITQKIAAGEVIERPAFAIKELVENALDAQATRIEVHLEESGLEKIIVYDNGIGMSREDILECYKAHTTSKISAENDLHQISSLGFRGEALSSIAAISSLRIQSRIKDTTVGALVEITHGTLEKTSSVGMPVGTHITVEQLFANVPVRKKFLKSQRTELRHSIELLTHLALAHPLVSLILLHNKKPIFELPGQTLAERIASLLGESIPKSLIPIKYADSYLKVAGFTSHPHISYPSSAKNYLCINGRPISDTLLTTAIKDAYGTLLESNQYPLAVIAIELPPHLVDVNVHPRKEYVNFLDRRFIFDSLQKAISETLLEHNITFNLHITATGGMQLTPKKQKKITATFAGDILKHAVLKPTQRNAAEDLRKITQIHKTYLLMPTAQGYRILDQHAAHERILYEQFVEAFRQQKSLTKSYQLPDPIHMEVAIADMEILREQLKIFESMGFEIKEVSPTRIEIKNVPLLFKDRNIEEMITEMLTDIHQELTTKTVDTRTHKLLTYLACRSAVKAGDLLDQELAQEIATQLERCKTPYTCPHGRPTRIEVSLEELNRFFKRS